jgi:xylose isomerase
MFHSRINNIKEKKCLGKLKIECFQGDDSMVGPRNVSFVVETQNLASLENIALMENNASIKIFWGQANLYTI